MRGIGGSRNFCQGGGSRPDCQKAALTTYISPCFLSSIFFTGLHMVSNGYFKKKSKVSEGSNIFQGGLNAIFYRNPYNL